MIIRNSVDPVKKNKTVLPDASKYTYLLIDIFLDTYYCTTVKLIARYFVYFSPQQKEFQISQSRMNRHHSNDVLFQNESLSLNRSIEQMIHFFNQSVF